MQKQLSRTVFIGSIIACHIMLVVILNDAVLLSTRLSETLPATALGFWFGKAAARNSQRSWLIVLAFHCVNLLGTLIGFGFQLSGIQTWTLGALAFAFAASWFGFSVVARTPTLPPPLPSGNE